MSDSMSLDDKALTNAIKIGVRDELDLKFREFKTDFLETVKTHLDQQIHIVAGRFKDEAINESKKHLYEQFKYVCNVSIDNEDSLARFQANLRHLDILRKDAEDNKQTFKTMARNWGIKTLFASIIALLAYSSGRFDQFWHNFKDIYR